MPKVSVLLDDDVYRHLLNKIGDEEKALTLTAQILQQRKETEEKKTCIAGELEFDPISGKAWFNSYPYGKCKLRIEGLTAEQVNQLSDEDDFLGITLRENGKEQEEGDEDE